MNTIKRSTEPMQVDNIVIGLDAPNTYKLGHGMAFDGMGVLSNDDEPDVFYSLTYPKVALMDEDEAMGIILEVYGKDSPEAEVRPDDMLIRYSQINCIVRVKSFKN